MWLTLVTSRIFEFEYRHSHSNWMCLIERGLYLVCIPLKRRPRILGYKRKSSSGPEVCRGRSRWRWGRRARTRRTGWRTPQTRRPSGRGNLSPSCNRFQLQQKMWVFFRFNSFLGKGCRPILFLFNAYASENMPLCGDISSWIWILLFTFHACKLTCYIWHVIK